MNYSMDYGEGGEVSQQSGEIKLGVRSVSKAKHPESIHGEQNCLACKKG